MYAQALHIHRGQGTEIIDAFHLVFHLYLSQLVEGGLFEVASAMLRASVVEDEEDIALLGHVCLPGATCPVPGGINVMGVRAAIDIDHRWVFLAGVEVVGLYHAEIKVGNAVGSLDGALFEVGLLIVCPRVGGIQQTRALAIGCIQQVDATRYLRGGVALNYERAAAREQSTLYDTNARIQERSFASIDIHGVGICLQQVLLVGDDDDALLLFIEAKQLSDYPRPLGQLFQFLALGVKKIEVVIAVFLALHDKLAAIPGQENDGILWLDIFVGGLAVELSDLLARRSLVADEAAVVLSAVQFLHIDRLSVRTPGDIREIAVGRIACLQIDRLFGFQVIDAYSHLMTRHACHRIFVWLIGGAAWENIHLRVVGHHALVHAVEGQPLSVGTPEEAFHDAKLIAVYSFAIHNLAAAVGSELLFLAVCQYIELMVGLLEGQCSGGLVPFLERGLSGRLRPFHLLCLEVV